MSEALDQSVLNQAFVNARTTNKFTGRDVPDALILQLYELMKWGLPR